ncbi:MAG: OsmC family peroxiredoxin [Bacteroidetes bacterium]|nr:MAG: OsmC family peroxiredoxin [Bacteroidota bacterium]
METVRTTYMGDYRTEATHVLSSGKLITDAPLDNNGKGEAFSPTDLVATALCSCMITLMDITANGKGFSLGEVSAKTTKVMAANPRRISEIIIEFDLTAKSYTDKEKAILEHAARNCPVAKSIHTDIHVDVSFHY